MEFCLTYAGPLYATQRDSRPGQPPRHIENKHLIRCAFHKQLKALWAISPCLDGPSQQRSNILLSCEAGDQEPATSIADLAKKHSNYGFNFVPLVTHELDLLCGIEILLLRPDRPGDVVWHGDIDNRIKTLLDAMRIPDAAENYVNRTASDDEQPFFCLLEDDKLITKLSVDTDRMLEPVNGNGSNDVRLFIKVLIKPYKFDVYTMHLA